MTKGEKVGQDDLIFKKIYQRTILYITVFLTGAVVLVVEILGTRILAPYFGTTIFVWSSLIAVTMGALALAYYLGGKIIDRWPSPKVFFATVLAAGFSLILITKVDQWVLPFCDRFGLRYGPLVASAILFGLPLLFLGMASPMVIRLILKDRKTAGSSAGRVFAIGTIGSIFGALSSGFYLLPYFTLSAIFLISGIILIIVSGIGLLSFKSSFVAIVLIVLSLFLPAYKYASAESGSKIIHQEQSFYGDIKIIDRESVRCLTVDGAEESCVTTGSNQSVVSYINEMGRIAQSRPADKNILVLGLGGGSLTNYFAAAQKVDIVEISPQIIKLAKAYFNFTPSANENMVTDDARHYLKFNNKKYDLVAMDVFVSSSLPIHLLTQDFFELLKSRLDDNGLVVINFVGLYNPTDQYTLSFIETLKSVFPSVAIEVGNDGLTNLVIQAGNSEIIDTHQSSSFKITQIDTTGSDIFTDAKNSADILAVPVLEAYREGLQSM